jgi:F-type H+-transporting ATPase subunit b
MIEINATLIAQIIHFLLLMTILTWVAYKPITQALADRRAYISDTLRAVEEQQAEAAKMKAEYQAQLVQARAEAQALIDKATKIGEQTREQLIRETKEETAKLLKQAQGEIQREREMALVQLRNEVATLSILAAGKIIGQTIDAKAQEKLIEDFINQLDSKGTGGLPC